MGKTAERLLAEMSSSELSEWMAYFRIEPFGEQRADLRAGVTAAAAANPGSLGEMIKLLFPPVKKKKIEKPRQGWRELKETLLSWTKAMGGRVIQK